MGWRGWALVLAGVTLVSLLTACRHLPAGGASAGGFGPARQRGFQVKGVVQEVQRKNNLIRIAHEEIPGYMAAMTMPFEVKDAQELKGVNAGDKVAFRMTVTDRDGWIDRIQVLEPAGAEAKPVIESVRQVRLVEDLKVGDLLPDYRFTNELRQAVSLRQFQGQALGFTFIYTRCPYPTFCPRMSNNFAEAAQQLGQRSNGPTNWHLLSISFDPAYDTPATLKLYARKYQTDPARWNFLTGAIIDLDAITEQFGMFFARDGAGFSHNARTVVADTQGRVQHIFTGNTWKVEEFVAEMVKAATRPASK